MTQPDTSAIPSKTVNLDVAPRGVPAAPPIPRPARAATPFVAALGLAVLAHLLTRNVHELGLNIFMWVAFFGGACLWALRAKGQAASREGVTLLGMALVLALTFVLWRVPDNLAGFNALALLLSLVLGAAYLRFPGLHLAGVGQMIGAAFTGGLRFMYGPFALLERFPWYRVKPAGSQGAGRWGIGVLLTVPVLLVFGGLLTSADDHFSRLVGHLFDWKLDHLFNDAFSLMLWCAFTGGLSYAALMALRPSLTPATGNSLARLGLIEVGLPLASLAALFVVFLLTQLPYFLGSLPDGLTFAEYIRKGFGELMTVAFLTLILLLSAHSLTRPEVRAQFKYRLLNLGVLLPLGLVILSAANRWQLYTAAYGLSEIRLLGAAFLVWLVLCLGWLAFLLWHGDLRRFAYPALLMGFGTLLGTTLLNPGALIARNNIHRQTAQVINDVRRTPQQADVWNLMQLGPDAVPVIVENLDVLARNCGPTENCANPQQRKKVVQFLKRQYGPLQDVRVWNLSEQRARQVVADLK